MPILKLAINEKPVAQVEETEEVVDIDIPIADEIPD